MVDPVHSGCTQIHFIKVVVFGTNYCGIYGFKYNTVGKGAWQYNTKSSLCSWYIGLGSFMVCMILLCFRGLDENKKHHFMHTILSKE